MNKYKTIEVIGEGAYGIVLKCKNKSLLQIIEEFKKGLPLEKIKSYSFQTCKAIQYCHSKDIIHRDVKPENLLINEKGILKLCDFGFARNLIRANDKLTEYVATRWYRAPELLLGDSYGKPVDIWSIGCIIGEMGDGEALFPGNSEIDQLYLIQKTLGPLPPSMVKHLLKSQRFAGCNCPISEASTTLEQRYKGILDYPLILLMKETLCLEPSQRLTADGCLNHVALKADLQSLNCNGNNTSRAHGTKVKLIQKKCSLPPVKFFLKSNKNRPRKLTCRVENGVLIQRLDDFLVKHCAEHSENNSFSVQEPEKQTDPREVLPVLGKEDISIDDTNSNNYPKSFCNKFSKTTKLNENKMLCASKKFNNLQHCFRELKRNPLVNIEVKMDENTRLNQSHPCSSVSLEITSVQKLTHRRKFKKLNEVEKSCLEEAAQDGKNPSRLSVGKDELVAPCLTPNSQTKENLEIINTRLPDLNVLQSESIRDKKNCRVYKPIIRNSRLAFRLKPIKSTNLSVTQQHSISSMIPVSTNVIKSSSCIFALHVEDKGKPIAASTKPNASQSKAKMFSSANYSNVKTRAAVKQNLGKKYVTDHADSATLNCKSRIPIAIRIRRKACHNS